MTYDLITDAQYDALPDEPGAKFAAFEAIVRAGMTKIIAESQSGEADNFVRMQYMAVVAGAAERLDIRQLSR